MPNTFMDGLIRKKNMIKNGFGQIWCQVGDAAKYPQQQGSHMVLNRNIPIGTTQGSESTSDN
jgi:hypothetical protein